MGLRMFELLGASYTYFLENQVRFWNELGRHLILSGSALAISLIVCVPLGIWATRNISLAQYVINGIGFLRLIPSLAILFLALPYLGTGFGPALIALTVLALPPVLINVYAGILSVERAVIEAACAMGMTSRLMSSNRAAAVWVASTSDRSRLVRRVWR